MYKLIVLYGPPSSPDNFRRYYESHHLPLAKLLPGMRASRYSFDVAALGGASPYFCIFEGEFDSLDAMSAALDSPGGRQVANDLRNFATGSATLLHFAPATH